MTTPETMFAVFLGDGGRAVFTRLTCLVCGHYNVPVKYSVCRNCIADNAGWHDGDAVRVYRGGLLISGEVLHE